MSGEQSKDIKEETDEQKKEDKDANAFLSSLVEVTGFEPVSKRIPQKLSTCLFHLLIVGDQQEMNKPTDHLAMGLR